MTQDSVSDELVKIIANKIGWFIGHTDADCMDTAQTIFAAIAPRLIADYQQSLNVLGEAYDRKCEEVLKARAEGMREAAVMFASDTIRHDSDIHRYVVKWYDRILARVAALDPPVKP